MIAIAFLHHYCTAESAINVLYIGEENVIIIMAENIYHSEAMKLFDTTACMTWMLSVEYGSDLEFVLHFQ